MNNLKCRAWHKEQKRYLPVDVVDFVDEVIYVYELVDEGYNNNVLYNFSSVIIEQFTGLKDKNGKEIYEGDIVKFYSKHIGKIVYRIGSLFFEEESGRHTPLCLFNPIDSEVIGNIHDNPELLESK